MIRWLASIVALMLAALPSLAQTVTLRSGEHATFTRFVIRLPQGADWRINRSDRSADLTVDIADILFDTSGVFSRIPRKRVSDVRQRNAGAPLTFDLACACTISTFIEDRALLVIDFRDAEDTAASAPRQAALTGMRPVMAESPYRFRFAADDMPAEPLVLPLAAGLVAREISPPNIKPDPGMRLPEASRITSVTALERALVDQISRALGQGLIEQAISPVEPPQSSQPAEKAEKALVQTDTAAGHDMRSNFAVTTTIDRDLNHLAQAIATGESANGCLPSEAVALNEWVEGQGFAADVGYWRARVIGEFDRVDRKAALALARTYLHFGFGAEAKHVLGMLESPTEEIFRLEALADIIDNGTTKLANPFADQLGCDSDAALWALLSLPDRQNESNRDAVVRAVSRLPVSLREHIGAEVARQMAKAGHGEEAASILRAIGRVIETPAPGQLLAAASAADLAGDSDLAARHRDAVAHGNSEHSPAAMIELVENRFAGRDTVPPDLPELAAAMATENRHNDFGPGLRRSQALALALTGRFGESFDALGVIVASDSLADAQRTREDLLQLLGERASDIEFLQYGLFHSEGHEADLSDELGDTLARRFIDLGFSRPAIRLLAGSQNNPATLERRRLRAKAALGQNLPHEALIAVMGMDDPESDRLRAEAMILRQDYAQAAPVLVSAGPSETAARSLWLAGQRVTGGTVSDDSFYDRLAAITETLERGDAGPSDMPPLARAQALIDASSTARQEIDALLGSIPVERSGQ